MLPSCRLPVLSYLLRPLPQCLPACAPLVQHMKLIVPGIHSALYIHTHIIFDKNDKQPTVGNLFQLLKVQYSIAQSAAKQRQLGTTYQMQIENHMLFHFICHCQKAISPKYTTHTRRSAGMKSKTADSCRASCVHGQSCSPWTQPPSRKQMSSSLLQHCFSPHPLPQKRKKPFFSD